MLTEAEHAAKLEKLRVKAKTLYDTDPVFRERQKAASRAYADRVRATKLAERQRLIDAGEYAPPIRGRGRPRRANKTDYSPAQSSQGSSESENTPAGV